MGESVDSAATAAESVQDAHGEIKVGADPRSAPTRSLPRDKQVASAQPSSPAFSRKREKEPEPQRVEPVQVTSNRSTSEPSPACRATSIDVGQGEGGAVCLDIAGSSATSRHAPTNDTGGSVSDKAATDHGNAAKSTAAAAPGPALAAAGDIVERIPPVYPLTARRQGLQGTAMVRARFDAQGKPEHVAVVASSGSASLDEAAREAVRRWRFRAGAAGVLDMPITFRLDARNGVAAAGG